MAVIARQSGARPPASWPSVIGRFSAALVGGYIFAAGYTALATLTGFVAGLPYSESQVLAWMTGALAYLGAIIAGFLPRTATRAWLILGGGGLMMGGAAYAFSRLLI